MQNEILTMDLLKAGVLAGAACSYCRGVFSSEDMLYGVRLGSGNVLLCCQGCMYRVSNGGIGESVSSLGREERFHAPVPHVFDSQSPPGGAVSHMGLPVPFGFTEEARRGSSYFSFPCMLCGTRFGLGDLVSTVPAPDGIGVWFVHRQCFEKAVQPKGCPFLMAQLVVGFSLIGLLVRAATMGG
jgi:hypothetical protein